MNKQQWIDFIWGIIIFFAAFIFFNALDYYVQPGIVITDKYLQFRESVEFLRTIVLFSIPLLTLVIIFKHRNKVKPEQVKKTE
jgi:hypothetical protein